MGPYVRSQLVEDAVEDSDRGVHELVDRCADDENHGFSAVQHCRIGRELEPSGRQNLDQQLIRAGLLERNVSRLHLPDLDLVDVIDSDAVARFGEGQRKRQTDVSAAADDHQVQVVHAAQIMIPKPMNASRKGAGRPSVLLDMRPLQGRSAVRGVGAYARGLLYGLIQAGFDANLTLLIDQTLALPDLPPGEYRLARCRRRSHGQLAAYEDAMLLATDIARLGPDVYHAIDFRLPRRTPCPLVVTLHDLIPWVWGGGKMRGERARYWLGRRLLRRADVVIAVSSSTAADATRLGVTEPSRLRVILEAADPLYRPTEGAAARLRERFGLDGSFLLFVGALDARKDPAALLGAWQTARRDHGDLKLVITGPPGKQAPPIMPGAVQLGLVGSDALADLYSAAGCLVFPSRYEGFGLPCVEAMACGCPVAAFHNSSLPEVVNGAGLLVDDGDVDALGRAAARMVHERDRWRAAGLERAKKFSWLATAQATISAYESVLG